MPTGSTNFHTGHFRWQWQPILLFSVLCACLLMFRCCAFFWNAIHKLQFPERAIQNQQIIFCAWSHKHKRIEVLLIGVISISLCLEHMEHTNGQWTDGLWCQGCLNRIYGRLDITEPSFVTTIFTMSSHSQLIEYSSLISSLQLENMALLPNLSNISFAHEGRCGQAIIHHMQSLFRLSKYSLLAMARTQKWTQAQGSSKVQKPLSSHGSGSTDSRGGQDSKNSPKQ